MSTSWLDRGLEHVRFEIAQYDQDCPDACGRKIVAYETKIAKVDGGWRHFECIIAEWDAYTNITWGTMADRDAAIKRITALGGHVVIRKQGTPNTRKAWAWTEYLP